MPQIYIYYRMSDKPAYAIKSKPSYINNKNCLNNFISNFGKENLHVIADSVKDETKKYLINKSKQYNFFFEIVDFKSGSKTFARALNLALQHHKKDIIYFVEDDFLHLPGSKNIIIEAFSETHADYVTLYDHPDKYIDKKKGGPNPFIKDGGESTRVILSSSTHWKITNSTVMTFATRVKTLKEDEKVWRKCTAGSIPADFNTFTKLCMKKQFFQFWKKKRMLISPIPGWATHGETEFLTPFIDWEKVVRDY